MHAECDTHVEPLAGDHPGEKRDALAHFRRPILGNAERREQRGIAPRLFALQDRGNVGRVEIGADDHPDPPLVPRKGLEALPERDEYSAGVIAWLDEQGEATRIRVRILRLVDQWIEEMKELYVAGRIRAGVRQGRRFGPGSTQWGRFLHAAGRPEPTLDALSAALFDGPSAICRPDDPEWSSEGIHAGRVVTFRDWLVSRTTDGLGQYPVREIAYALGLLAARTREYLRSERDR